jgi:hypothetical protein
MDAEQGQVNDRRNEGGLVSWIHGYVTVDGGVMGLVQGRAITARHGFDRGLYGIRHEEFPNEDELSGGACDLSQVQVGGLDLAEG